MGYVIAFVLGGNVGVLLMCLMFATRQRREEMELRNSHEKAESETEGNV